MLGLRENLGSTISVHLERKQVCAKGNWTKHLRSLGSAHSADCHGDGRWQHLITDKVVTNTECVSSPLSLCGFCFQGHSSIQTKPRHVPPKASRQWGSSSEGWLQCFVLSCTAASRVAEWAYCWCAWPFSGLNCFLNTPAPLTCLGGGFFFYIYIYIYIQVIWELSSYKLLKLSPLCSQITSRCPLAGEKWSHSAGAPPTDSG